MQNQRLNELSGRKSRRWEKVRNKTGKEAGPGTEGPADWECEFHPQRAKKSLTGFKQATDTIQCAILKDFSLKIPLLMKIWGTGAETRHSPIDLVW